MLGAQQQAPKHPRWARVNTIKRNVADVKAMLEKQVRRQAMGALCCCQFCQPFPSSTRLQGCAGAAGGVSRVCVWW